MFLLDNKPLQIDQPFTHNGVQYPANWLRLTSMQEKNAIGITEVPDPVLPDSRFYYISQQGEAVPKDLAILKTSFIQQVNRDAFNNLAATDWYVVRKQEVGTEIPEKIVLYRNKVRQAAESNKVAINAASTIQQLIAAVDSIPSSWPEQN